MTESTDISLAAKVIKGGGLVAFPTETVYGLGADALNPEAVAKIFTEKERPSFDPLIVHIASLDEIPRLTIGKDDRVYTLAKRFWPGPLTIVLPKSDLVPDIVTSGLPTVGIRFPNNPIALALIKSSGCPLAAPSANKFGRISPTTAQHVRKQLPNVDCILDGGPSFVGIESTVIALNTDGFVILREGFITAEDLRTVLPASNYPVDNDNKLSSPGLLNSHYSPQKPIFIEGEDSQKSAKFLEKASFLRGAYLSFSGRAPGCYGVIEYLSKTGDLREAAVNLFGALHRLEDNYQVDFIVAEPVPQREIGIAIMDRLKKAAYKYKK
ncbi:MAG: threonylcarbamoyl-AMP synthase [Bacteroidetes bacterium HGW-Bacteroidetes-8]|jgi:L-threonylcarbamoyladenylate synthase|nr:MAG: threonylcarbamoyl-AMP synthase [Bacteroidetes bacterium HGW-Bacteroidetes-8]